MKKVTKDALQRAFKRENRKVIPYQGSVTVCPSKGHSGHPTAPKSKCQSFSSYKTLMKQRPVHRPSIAKVVANVTTNTITL